MGREEVRRAAEIALRETAWRCLDVVVAPTGRPVVRLAGPGDVRLAFPVPPDREADAGDFVTEVTADVGKLLEGVRA